MAVFSPAGWDTPTWAQATRGGRVPTCRAAAYVADQRLRQRAGPRLPTACGSPVLARKRQGKAMTWIEVTPAEAAAARLHADALIALGEEPDPLVLAIAENASHNRVTGPAAGTWS